MTLESLLIYKGVLVGIVLVSLFMAERLAPNSKQPQFLSQSKQHAINRLARNISLWLLNSALSPLLLLPITLYAASHALTWRPESQINLPLDLLLLDCWIYWWHRVNHSLPFLWRFHQIHHLDRWLDVTSSVRFHFGEVFISAIVRGSFIWLMGISWLSVIVFETLVLMCSGFQHSNIKLPPKLEYVLSRLIVTPSIHWVHHHALRKDTDSNYATIFSFWDRLFKSRSLTNRGDVLKLGVEGELNDKKLFQLAIKPFLN